MLSRLWASPALLLVTATLCWSGNFVLGRALHAQLPPIGLSFWRWTLACLIVLAVSGRQVRRDWPLLRQHWPRVALLGFLGVACFNAMVFYGLHTTTVINAVLMQSTMPVLIILVSWALFRESVGALQALAVAISLTGVAVVMSGGSLATLLSLSVVPGDAWIALAVVCYALYSALLRRRPPVHALSFFVATSGIGALVLLPLYVIESLTVQPLHLDTTSLTALAYVALFPSLLAYLSFNRAVELIGANRAGQYLHLTPLFGTTMAALMLGETLHTVHLLGASLIAIGIVLARFAGNPAAQQSLRASRRGLI